jgi:translation initiation factor 2B subunit (eIF-2B alpha/beta/delta family)
MDLEAIANDTTHGATYLTKALVDLAKEQKNIPGFLRQARRIQPMMASIHAFLRDLEEAWVAGEDVGAFCGRWWEEYEKAHKRVVREGAELVSGRTILAHSYSTAVAEALELGGPKRVICTESRPKNEGIELAKRLGAAGIDVELVIDAAAPSLTDEADLVLFGSDGVGESGLVHKVGSFGIAAAAKQTCTPVVALSHPKKRWPAGFSLPPEPPRDPDEICRCDLRRRNFYFDITPLHLIDLVLE